jgi:hypothetical protein
MKGIADDLYEEYSSLKSNINAFRYTNVTNSDRDNKLIDRIKSFIESYSESQQKILNENRDIEGLKLFIEVLFEFKVALELMTVSNGQEQQSEIVSVRINGCVVTYIPFLIYKTSFASFYV